MIRLYSYDASGVQRHEQLAEARDAAGTTWVEVTGGDAGELDRVAEAFGIHQLSIEDLQGGVRPKTEQFASHTFVLARTAALRRGETTFDEEIRTIPIGLFLGDDWLVTVTRTSTNAVERVRNAVESDGQRVRQHGPDFLVYRIVDGIVDDYFDVLDEVETTIEEVEDGILEGPDPTVLEALNSVRRDLLSFRKVLWPMREATGILARGDPDQVQEQTEKYFRDVYDHLVQLVDLTETYRELARGARDIYLSSLSQSTNEVMRALTVVATIILPLTLVVGIYGMNFSGGPFNMPELGWRFGYPAVMLGMVFVSVVMVAYFRERGWL